ncbi:MAG: PepSY domain-containing protein, partial [Acidobacteriaceae bacterium]|nr:PepSY domain-containing protein [Acidobacteriaceae bacterium]
YPLHFGTLWGLPVKMLWCLLGLCLPVLSITGLLMYWNRHLRTRWRALF